MKKIYYFLILGLLSFTACQKQPLVTPFPDATVNVTLADADYQILGKTIYADSTFSFNSVADAKLYIPTILNSKYPQLNNGTKANIGYSLQVKLADSVYKDVAYTLTNADYLLLPNNKYTDFSTAQILEWLPYKYLTPSQNQEAILTFNYYNNGTTVATPLAFLYTNTTWQQIYLLTPAQYTAVGRGGTYNQFSGSDNVAAYINVLLKADPSVSATAVAGNTKYVSFNFYNSTGKVTSQRVLNFEYTGSNWVTASSGNQAFLVSNNKWIPDPTVYYTLTAADTKLIAASSIGGSAFATVLANLGSYGDFESAWTSAANLPYLDQALILALQANFKSPVANVNYKVTFNEYKSGGDVPTVFTFIYNGTAWVAQQ